jgi:hypothetical protein
MSSDTKRLTQFWQSIAFSIKADFLTGKKQQAYLSFFLQIRNQSSDYSISWQPTEPTKITAPHSLPFMTHRVGPITEHFML